MLAVLWGNHTRTRRAFGYEKRASRFGGRQSMVRICCSFAFASAILLGLSASAQEPKIDLRRDLERNRHDDPKLAVRRRAEARGEQRAQRLASSKWYGIYNSRPTVSPTPWFSTYSPSWVSNTYDPARWRMPAVPVVANLPENARY